MSTPDSVLRERSIQYESSELIGLAYEAASVVEDLWPTVFTELDLSLGKRLSTLVFRGFGPTRYVDLSTSEPRFAGLNPGKIFQTKGLSRRNFVMAFVGRELVEDWSQLQLVAQDFSAEGKPPSGIEVFARERSRLEPEDLDILRSLLPHLHRAYGLHFELRHFQSERDALASCLDQLADGVFVLDDKATILHKNHAAGAYLAERDGVTYDEGKLRASDEDDVVPFRRALKRATRHVLSGQRLRNGETLWMRGLGGDRTVVFVGGNRRSREIAPELLEEALDITPAEARVAALLAAGQPLPRIGAELDISVHTVRLHIKKMLAKTGTNRQASLVVRMLEALPPTV